jgi:hypothetical protein
MQMISGRPETVKAGLFTVGGFHHYEATLARHMALPMLILIVVSLWIGCGAAIFGAIDAGRRHRGWRCIGAAALAVPLLVVAAFLSRVWAQNPAGNEFFFVTNFGFGSEWICSSNRGNFTDLVCMQKPAADPDKSPSGTTETTQSN